MEGTAARHPARIQVSNTKKPVFFYVNLAKRFLQEHGEVQLSALGLAISSMVTVAEILKNSRLAVEQKITTGLDAFNDDGRERAVQKPKMEIVLRKSEDFDQVMAQQTRQPTAPQPAAPVAASAT
ncbi:MAG: Alba DNA RNA-binding [Trebouxia sp. A1-2]|nr:MAG: Alba DNA RNA-binding [Trebouxia sp. A1-2]